MLPLRRSLQTVIVLVPVCYVVIFMFVLFVFRNAVLPATESGWRVLEIMHGFVALLAFGTIIALTVAASRNRSLRAAERICWIAALWLVGLIAVPLYFFKYVRS